MRLFVSLTSPYARMCRAVVIEKDLGDQVEEIVVNPYEDPAELLAVSPAGTVPALARDDDGAPIADSRLICSWLDHLPSSRPALLPEGGPERMTARLSEALAQSLTDKSVAMTMEKRRPAERQHAPYLARLQEQALRLVGAAAPYAGSAEAPSTISTLAIACALGHLDLRHAELDWRADNAALGAWFEGFCARESMARTTPRDPA